MPDKLKPYEGPLSWDSDDHDTFAMSVHNPALKEVHQTIARDIRRHYANPITPIRLVRELFEQRKTKARQWAIAAYCLRERGIATNCFTWTTATEDERKGELAEFSVNIPILVSDEHLANFNRFTTSKGEPTTRFADGPNRLHVWDSPDGLVGIAIWDIVIGNPVVIPVPEYLFLRDRHPGATWHLPTDMTRRTPVVLSEYHKAIAGTLVVDVRRCPIPNVAPERPEIAKPSPDGEST